MALSHEEIEIKELRITKPLIRVFRDEFPTFTIPLLHLSWDKLYTYATKQVEILLQHFHFFTFVFLHDCI